MWACPYCETDYRTEKAASACAKRCRIAMRQARASLVQSVAAASDANTQATKNLMNFVKSLKR